MANIPLFRPVKSQDKVLTLVQQNLNNSLTPALSNPLLNGTYVVVTFPNKADSDIVVTHGLNNSKGVQWLVGSTDRAVLVYLSPNNESPVLNPTPANQIVLRANVPNAEIGLWFFNINSQISIDVGTNNPLAASGNSVQTSLTLTGTLTVEGETSLEGGTSIENGLTVTGGETVDNLTVTGTVTGDAFDDFELAQVLDFSYNSVSPLVCQQIFPNQVIDMVIVVLDVPFNDPTATVTFGNTANPSLILGSSDTDLTIIDQYANGSLTLISAMDYLIFTINPGASTQGSGTLFYRIKGVI